MSAFVRSGLLRAINLGSGYGSQKMSALVRFGCPAKPPFPFGAPVGRHIPGAPGGGIDSTADEIHRTPSVPLGFIEDGLQLFTGEQFTGQQGGRIVRLARLA